jgi:hypothetical protein
MDYEHEFKRLLEDVDKFRNFLVEERGKMKGENNERIAIEYTYLIKIMDITFSTHNFPHVEPLNNSDRVVLNDKTQEVVDETRRF